MYNLIGKYIHLTLIRTIEHNILNDLKLNIPMDTLNWKIYDSNITNNPTREILKLNPSKKFNL